MKLEYTALANSIKQKALNDYEGIAAYFDKAEAEILLNPFDSVYEAIIANGERVNKAYKKTVKTDIFSGRFPNSYLYLSLSYAASSDKTKLKVYGVYIRTYAP
jgi:hypothetical protein